MAVPARRAFQPRTRGDLRDALSKRDGLRLVAPESPWPSEILTSVLAGTGDALTHDDIKLWKLLVHLAYGDDPSMPDGVTETEYSDIIRFLDNRCRREDVRRSFGRLKRAEVSFGTKAYGRYYEGVALIHGWGKAEGGSDALEYELPRPIRELMRDQTRGYGYLELDALRLMRSKYTLALYRRIAWHIGREGKKWVAGADNEFKLTYTPKSLAQAVGFPVAADGTVHGGKLKAQVVDRIAADFRRIQGWTANVEAKHGKGRGRPLERVEITVRLAQPAYHQAPYIRPSREPDPNRPRIGAADDDRYCVDSLTWRKAAKAYGKLLAMGSREMFEAWLVALDEALEGKPLTKEAYKRRFRGSRLLEAIEDDGANEAAWGFITEEAHTPDIVPGVESTMEEFCKHVDRVEAADRRRRKRVDWDRLRRRVKATRMRRLEAEEREMLGLPKLRTVPVPPPPVRRPAPQLVKDSPSAAPQPQALPEKLPKDIEGTDRSRVTAYREEPGYRTYTVLPQPKAVAPDDGRPDFKDFGGYCDRYKAAMLAWRAGQSYQVPEPREESDAEFLATAKAAMPDVWEQDAGYLAALAEPDYAGDPLDD